MGKKEDEIKKAEDELKKKQEKLEELQRNIKDVERELEEAQERLVWIKKSPIDQARVLAINALESAMKRDKKNGTEAYQQVISALKEDTPESKLAVVLNIFLGAVVPDEEE